MDNLNRDGVSFTTWYKQYKLDVVKNKELQFIEQNTDKRSRLQEAIHKGVPEDDIIKMIDELGDNCFPDHVSDYGNTALSIACGHNLNKVATKLIVKFGALCQPFHICVG